MADIHISLERGGTPNFMPYVKSTIRSPFDFHAKAICRVRVCSFTFFFANRDQIQACLDFYSRKIHPSSRIRHMNGCHWEFQRWCDRLPLYLREEPKRVKVVAALSRALKMWDEAKKEIPISSLQRRGRSEWVQSNRQIAY
jgi:hypothetical protein